MRPSGQSGHGSGDSGPKCPARPRPEIIAEIFSTITTTDGLPVALKTWEASEFSLGRLYISLTL